MFLVNSRYRRFAATSFRSTRKGFTYQRHTLSRSYGVNLPSSLTRVLPSALVFSTCPPESVCSTVTMFSTRPAAFLGSMGSLASPRRASSSPLGVDPAFYSYQVRLQAFTDIQSSAELPCFVTAPLQHAGSGILTRFPSASPFGYTLGAD